MESVFNLHMFQSIAKYIRKYFKHPELIKLLEFPVLFLGATPQNTPALYSLMNYADITLGTWYPKGGMYSIVKGMVSLAEELGVKFEYNQEVTKLIMDGKNIHKVITGSGEYKADVVVGGADYHHIEPHLLDAPFRMYN